MCDVIFAADRGWLRLSVQALHMEGPMMLLVEGIQDAAKMEGKFLGLEHVVCVQLGPGATHQTGGHQFSVEGRVTLGVISHFPQAWTPNLFCTKCVGGVSPFKEQAE